MLTCASAHCIHLHQEILETFGLMTTFSNLQGQTRLFMVLIIVSGTILLYCTSCQVPLCTNIIMDTKLLLFFIFKTEQNNKAVAPQRLCSKWVVIFDSVLTLRYEQCQIINLKDFILGKGNIIKNNPLWLSYICSGSISAQNLDINKGQSGA